MTHGARTFRRERRKEWFQRSRPVARRRVGKLLRAALPRLAKSAGVSHDVPLSSIVTWDWPGSSVGLTRGSGWCRQTRNCTEIDRSGTMYKIVRRVYKFELFFFAARRCACVVASPRAQRMSTASEARRHAQQRK